ncbi:hypothetical protein [Micromonospora tulbaghiae]|uniref:hypothetical protein n=1 Tax=Micromonospora tulbaghiae TaxID=479978 RepID=UPI0033D43262
MTVHILSGKHKGATAQLHQWSNDWLMVDVDGGRPGIIVRPTMIRIEGDTYWRLRESLVAFEQNGDRSCGTFWTEWALHDDGTLTRRA